MHISWGDFLKLRERLPGPFSAAFTTASKYLLLYITRCLAISKTRMDSRNHSYRLANRQPESCTWGIISVLMVELGTERLAVSRTLTIPSASLPHRKYRRSSRCGAVDEQAQTAERNLP